MCDQIIISTLFNHYWSSFHSLSYQFQASIWIDIVCVTKYGTPKTFRASRGGRGHILLPHPPPISYLCRTLYYSEFLYPPLEYVIGLIPLFKDVFCEFVTLITHLTRLQISIGRVFLLLRHTKTHKDKTNQKVQRHVRMLQRYTKKLKMRTALEMIHRSQMYSKMSDLLIVSPSYLDAIVDCAIKENWSCAWTMQALATVIDMTTISFYPRLNGSADKVKDILNRQFLSLHEGYGQFMLSV